MNYGTAISLGNQPFDDRFTYNTVADAAGAPTKYRWENQLIWIKGEKKFYYLIDGADGSSVSHWQELNEAVSTFPPYQTTSTYSLGNGVSLGTGMYIAIASVAVNETPITNPEKWLQLGATQSFTQDFTNQTNVVVNHSISNAICVVYDTNGFPLGVLIEKNSSTQFTISASEAVSGTIIIK